MEIIDKYFDVLPAVSRLSILDKIVFDRPQVNVVKLFFGGNLELPQNV